MQHTYITYLDFARIGEHPARFVLAAANCWNSGYFPVLEANDIPSNLRIADALGGRIETYMNHCADFLTASYESPKNAGHAVRAVTERSIL
jgi:hypothetical protein